MVEDLSVIVPVFNESRTIRLVIERLLALTYCSFELIIVDDGSTDETPRILGELHNTRVSVILKKLNEGKTSAVRAGLAVAKGKWVLVQDADLEYDPGDIQLLLSRASDAIPVVYGCRPSCWQKPSRWLFAAGVLLIDVCMFCVYRRWIRDHATCYKLVPRNIMHALQLQSTGFEGCIEITAKLMRSGIPIAQVPISYRPRTFSEGKKLTASYGLIALANVLRWRNWSPATESIPTSNAGPSAAGRGRS